MVSVFKRAGSVVSRIARAVLLPNHWCKGNASTITNNWQSYLLFLVYVDLCMGEDYIYYNYFYLSANLKLDI